jgi:hypothetical protein
MPGGRPLITMNSASAVSMGGGGPGTWGLIGHFADPAADTCAASGYLAERQGAAETVHYCRMVMVLDTPPTLLKRGY